MTGSGTVVSLDGAQQGKALKLNTTMPANGSVTSSTQGTSLVVRAKGDQCQGAPQLSLKIDGQEKLRASVSATNWTVYKTSAVIPAGTHTISANMVSLAKKKSCSRAVYVDVVTIFDDTAVPPPSDTIAPKVSITAPANGATVSGTSKITASASDNVAVTKVEFYISGQNSGSPVSTVTASPYNYTWDTTEVVNGGYGLSAKAYDAAGNVASTTNATSVTVNNSATTPPESMNPTGVTGTWALKFDDEFSTTSLDTTKWWDTCTYPAAPGWHGCNTAQGTVQWYMPRYAIGHEFGSPYQIDQSNGILRLTATKRDPGVGAACAGSQCTWAGARVQTGPEYDGSPNRFEMKYGFIEGRMKVPHGKGFWPSFWLSGPNSIEIDVFEFLAGNTKRIFQTNHGVGGVGGSLEEYYSPAGTDYADGQWHTFGLDWEPDHISWYVDGVLARSTITSTTAIPSDPMRLWIDFPVGTEWGASGVPDGGGQPDATTPSTANFDVDYVRVWLKQ